MGVKTEHRITLESPVFLSELSAGLANLIQINPSRIEWKHNGAIIKDTAKLRVIVKNAVGSDGIQLTATYLCW